MRRKGIWEFFQLFSCRGLKSPDELSSPLQGLDGIALRQCEAVRANCGKALDLLPLHSANPAGSA